MKIEHIGTMPMTLLVIGLILSVAAPLAVWLIWLIRKKERFTTILIGAATFLLFALILEKPIQNVLLFPTAMGLSDHGVSRFFMAHPVLLAFMTGLFPGVFEETGRFVAFKTILKKRKNRETSISHGIGHGGFEVMYILGLTFVQYVSYAALINADAFQTVVDQVKQLAPEQLGTLEALVAGLASFSFANLGVLFFERIFAVLFHVGGSMLVFYACRDKKRFWLYPLAILLHTLMDFVAALQYFGIINLSTWALEGFVAITGSATFFGAFYLLYKKDEMTGKKTEAGTSGSQA